MSEMLISRSDVKFLLDAISTFEAELEQLEITGDWFVSDSRDRLEAAKQILFSLLGIQDYEYEYETEQTLTGVYEDEEGGEDNWDEASD